MNFERELNRMVEKYRNDGYEAVAHPTADQLPEFAKDFKVEIVGRRGKYGVIVTVKQNHKELRKDKNFPRYAELIEMEPNWRYDLAVLEGLTPEERETNSAREFTVDEIEQSLEEAQKLDHLGQTRFALVAVWAALEAALRMGVRAILDQKPEGGPQLMFGELYSSGPLTKDEYYTLQNAFYTRNQIVRGYVPETPPINQPDSALIQRLIEITRRIVAEAQAAESQQVAELV